MRVVLDTNVLIRAANGIGSPAREIVDLCATSPNSLLVSDLLLSELVRVMRYPRVRNIHRLSDVEIEDYVEEIRGIGELVEVPLMKVVTLSEDRDDDFVIHLACAGDADHLCTLDRHLRTKPVVDYCRASGIQVVTDIELLAALRKQS